MEQEKNNNNLLIVLVIVLSILVLAIGGYFVYDKVVTKDNATASGKEITTDNASNDEGQEKNTSDILWEPKVNMVKSLENEILDEDTLNSLFDIVGINHDGKEVKACLNNYVTKRDILGIISWTKDFKSYTAKYLFDDGSPVPVGDTVVASEDEIKRIFNRYMISKSISEYGAFKPFEDIVNDGINMKASYDNIENYDSTKNYYTFVPYHHVGNCEYEIEHNISVEWVDPDHYGIKMIDKQNVSTYKFSNGKYIREQNYTQTVWYEFKKGVNGKFNLDINEIKIY